MSNDNNAASEGFVGAVEKSELMSAVGREIKRIDQLATSNGYTSWALWGAIGVVGWKVVDIMQSGLTSKVGLVYVFIVAVLSVGREILALLSSGEKGRGQVYFRYPSRERSARLGAVLVGSMNLLCLLIYLSFIPLGGWLLVFPCAYYIFPVVGILKYTFGQPFPISDFGFPKKGVANKFAALLIWVWIFFGSFSAYLMIPYLNLPSFGRPDGDVRVAILCVVITVLVFRLAQNLSVMERRQAFQRLETELTLSKVDMGEARVRYENLMIGMNVSSAVRPWVDAVTIPLDEANSGLSEIAHLLNKIEGEGQGDRALMSAIFQRISSLLDDVGSAVDKSSKAYGALEKVCFYMFGTINISESPLSDEARKISQSIKIIRKSLVDAKDAKRKLADVSFGEVDVVKG